MVPVTDLFGELAQLWTEVGAADDGLDRVRWPNHLEHFKAFRYLFDGPEAAQPEVWPARVAGWGDGRAVGPAQAGCTLRYAGCPQ